MFRGETMKILTLQKELVRNFTKWFNINYSKDEILKTEHVKRYLGYFGINRRFEKKNIIR